MQNAVMPDEERELVLAATAGRLREKARARRQVRCYLVAFVTLGVFTATLAAVNVALSRRAAQPVVASAPAPARETPPAPSVAATPEAAPAPAAPTTSAPATSPGDVASAPAAPAAPSATSTRSAASTPAPSAAPAAVAAAASEAKPPKPAVATKPPVVVAPKSDASAVKRAVAVRSESRKAGATAVQPAAARGKMEPRAPESVDSSTRVARWLVTTYGKSDAERQAALAITYYPAGDERTEHWRKVLRHIRTTTE